MQLGMVRNGRLQLVLSGGDAELAIDSCSQVVLPWRADAGTKARHDLEVLRRYVRGLCEQASSLNQHVQSITAESISLASASPPSGLEWRNAGSIKPTEGVQVDNKELAAALAKRTTFTEQEWKTFKITDLRVDSFIKSGDTYFKPVLHFPVVQEAAAKSEALVSLLTDDAVKEGVELEGLQEAFRKISGELRSKATSALQELREALTKVQRLAERLDFWVAQEERAKLEEQAHEQAARREDRKPQTLETLAKTDPEIKHFLAKTRSEIKQDELTRDVQGMKGRASEMQALLSPGRETEPLVLLSANQDTEPLLADALRASGATGERRYAAGQWLTAPCKAASSAL